MSKANLTWRQAKVLRFVRSFTAAHGYSPSMREIGDAVGLSSTSSVSYQLRELEAKGLIRRNGQGSPRAIVGAGGVTISREDALVILGGSWTSLEMRETLGRLRSAMATAEAVGGSR